MKKTEINIFDKDFDITKMIKVGDLVAAFIMKLRDPYAKSYDKNTKNKYANAEYVHIGKLRKFLNEKYKAYDK